MLSKQLDKIVSSLTPEDVKATLLTLRKIFDNISQHPNDDKFCQIKLANKIFSSKVWRYPACEELMKISGWVVEDDHVRLRDESHVHIVSQLLESLGGQEDVQIIPTGNSITKHSIAEYESIFSAVINGNIPLIKHLLKPCNISLAGMIYCENGSSTNLLSLAIFVQEINVLELIVNEHSVDPYIQ